MLKEFKEFAMRGNVLDLAVAVILAGAFGKIVDTLVKGILMPIVGQAIGHVDFKDLKVVLTPEGADPKKNPEVAILYGQFFNDVITFILVAFCVFLVVKAVNRLRHEEPAPVPAGPSAEEVLLTEIRDAIRTKA